MTTKQNIMDAAVRKSPIANLCGDFVNTDGKWCLCQNPAEFKEFLENEFGFKVVRCYETATSTAIAETEDGYKIAYNGFCTKMNGA